MPRTASSAAATEGEKRNVAPGRLSGRRNAGSDALTAAAVTRDPTATSTRGATATSPPARRGHAAARRLLRASLRGRRRTGRRSSPITVMWPTPFATDRCSTRRCDPCERCDVVDDAGAVDERAVDGRRDDVRERVAEARVRRVDRGRRSSATPRAPTALRRARAPRSRRARASRAPPPQPPAPARPAVEALGDRRRLAAAEHDRIEAEPREDAAAWRRGGARWRCARSRASRPLIRTSPTSPDVASRTGRSTPPTRGNDCSHVGSWITTGVTSQRSARSLSQMFGETASMKSETTKTNVPAGKLDACRTSARRQPSSDAGPAAAAIGLVVRLERARARSAAGPARAIVVGPPVGRRRRARPRRQPLPGRSTQSPPPSPPACRARAAAARRAPSAAGGRPRARPAAPCRRRTRGRRTRRCRERPRGAPTRASRSRSRRSPGR